jgi:hypothetical protein
MEAVARLRVKKSDGNPARVSCFRQTGANTCPQILFLLFLINKINETLEWHAYCVSGVRQ